MHTFLFEIGTEELPAGEIDAARTSLLTSVTQALQDAGVAFEAARSYATPRRLALRIDGLAPTSRVYEEELIGPPARVAFDAEGRPTKAAEGFARKEGLSVDALRRVETPRGEYLAATVTRGGAPTAELLASAVPAAIEAIPWKRSMRWGWGTAAFARPVHWLLALLDDAVLPLTWNGLASDRITRGHRFLAPDALSVTSPDTWLDQLRDAWVLADVEERRERIVAGLRAEAAAHDARLVDDEGLLDFSALLDEVTHLVEWPVVLTGAFAPELLEVPREVLITSMASHQRYFSLAEPGSAGADTRLRNLFCFVTNMDARPGASDEARRTLFDTIIAGNLRVLRARLEDARFFYTEDLKRSLADRVPDLARITFLEELGEASSELARTQRVERLTAWLCDRLAPGDAQVRATATRAAHLFLADRTTGLVDEFPELERIMGAYYALASDEPAGVARAIEASLAPRQSQSPCSDDLAGSLLGLAIRLQRVADVYAVRKEPTGSADPYAVRRNVLGLLDILANEWTTPAGPMRFALDVREALAWAADGLPASFLDGRPTLVDEALAYVQTRLRNQLSPQDASTGIATDVADAVAAVTLPNAGPSALATARSRADALTALRDSPDFEPLAAAFRRIDNILRKAADEGPVPDAFDADLFVEPAERSLAEALATAGAEAGAELEAERWQAAAARLIGMKAAIDRFFDDVMVNADDPAIRANRLGLLASLRSLFLRLADIARIQPAAREH